MGRGESPTDRKEVPCGIISSGTAGGRAWPPGMNYAPSRCKKRRSADGQHSAPKWLALKDADKKRQTLFAAVVSFLRVGGRLHEPSMVRRPALTATSITRLQIGRCQRMQSVDLKGEKQAFAMNTARRLGDGCLCPENRQAVIVPCVEVDLGGWDCIQGFFPALKNQALPTLDKPWAHARKDWWSRILWKIRWSCGWVNLGRNARTTRTTGSQTLGAQGG